MGPTSRRDFLRSTAALGAILALPGCGLLGDDDPADVSGSFDGKVLIIGAGAAGMTAAHLLRRQGVTVDVLEAKPTPGGRIAHDTDFVDFPISLGGEWIHVDPEILGEIVDDPELSATTDLSAYAPTDTWVWIEDGQVQGSTAGDDVDTDLKFVGSSWLGFFEDHVLPGIDDRITYDTVVTSVTDTGDGVEVVDADGVVRTADRVIVTIPMFVLRSGAITFDPPLPDDHLEALDRAELWGGMKVFIEFSEPFFPTFFAPEITDTGGQRLYYDAGYGQDSDHHVLGLFSVGGQAEPYQALDAGDELRDHVLAELDAVFDGAASRTYVQHISKNWSADPFAGAAYLADDADWRVAPALAEPVTDRIDLAGCSYFRGGSDWSSVHTAARSARNVVDRILS